MRAAHYVSGTEFLVHFRCRAADWGLLVAIALYGLSLRGCCALKREVQGNHPLSNLAPWFIPGAASPNRICSLMGRHE
jgi:hypothetical protein